MNANCERYFNPRSGFADPQLTVSKKNVLARDLFEDWIRWLFLFQKFLVEFPSLGLEEFAAQNDLEPGYIRFMLHIWNVGAASELSCMADWIATHCGEN